MHDEDYWAGIREANHPHTLSADDFDFVAERDLTWRAALKWLLGLFKSGRL